MTDRVLNLRMGWLSFTLACVMTTASPASGQEIPPPGAHPPPGVFDPYMQLRDARGRFCCGGHDCHPIPAAAIRYSVDGLELFDHETQTWLPVLPDAIVTLPEALRRFFGGTLHACISWRVTRPGERFREVRCVIMEMA